jgi:hypothetical protein
MNILKNSKLRIAVVGIATLVMLTACTGNSEESEKGGRAATEEQQAVATGFERLTKSQQVPVFDWSQERQTVIDVETIRATGATSTTAFYLEGVGMIGWCPSAGAPVPSTYQLTGSTQWVDLPGDESRVLYGVEQGEPTGVYIGGSSGTWTLCLDDNGNKFAKYWEGYVDSTVGIITSYPADKRVVVEDLTFEFTEAPGS